MYAQAEFALLRESRMEEKKNRKVTIYGFSEVGNKIVSLLDSTCRINERVTHSKSSKIWNVSMKPYDREQIQATCFSKCPTLTLSMIMSVYSDLKVVHIPWLNVKIQLCCSAMVLFQKHCWKYGGLKLPCTLVKEKRCFVISFVPKHANKFPLGAIPTKLLLLVRSKELSCPVPSRAR